jgi:hypothetical protein
MIRFDLKIGFEAKMGLCRSVGSPAHLGESDQRAAAHAGDGKSPEGSNEGRRAQRDTSARSVG